MIDYIGLIKTEKKHFNRVAEVSDITATIKRIATTRGISVIQLAQMNRGVESRNDKTPMLADLRESGSIEQDADVVMFLYRNDESNLEDVKLSIAKHRNGGLGIMDLKFRGDRVKFYGVERGR